MPGIHGKGYTFDIECGDPNNHVDINLGPNDDAYGFSMYKPGTARLAVICDFGIFK